MEWGKEGKNMEGRKDQRVKRGGKNKKRQILFLRGGVLPGPYPLARFMHWI